MMTDQLDAISGPKQTKETLALNPDLFFARIRIPNDPIVAFRSYYLTEANLKLERSIDFERIPPLSLSINNFNLQAEAAAFIEREALQETVAGQVAKLIPKNNKLGFKIIANVYDYDMPLPRAVFESGPLAGRYSPHVIKVRTDKDQGYLLECDSLTKEQIDFCLSLLIRTLDFTLKRAGKGRTTFEYDEVLGKPEDGFVYDHCLVTASDADLERDLSATDREEYGKFRDQKTNQLKYLKMTLQEILGKRTGAKGLSEAT